MMAQRNPRLIAGIYQVGQTLQSGPLLTTYTAYNRNTSDVVGLLVITLPAGSDPAATSQLLAPLARRRGVQSQHVIRVYDWGLFEGKAYIATDPPRGITLEQLQNSENIALPRALDLAIQLTRGVAALQAHGIVDTDLRPQLITVDTIGLDDRVQIDDVGLRSLCWQLGYAQGLNIHDIGYLDQRYMAPESLYQHVISSASDVYQLGILLFELITGRPPFVGQTPAETGMMQSNSPVPRMSQYKHDAPAELQVIVDRALAKDPQQRYPHASAMLAELEAAPRPRDLTISGNWPSVAFQPTILPEALPPTVKSSGLTGEITKASPQGSLDPDKTLIDGKPIPERQPNSTTLVPENATVYAYLDFEQEGGVAQRLEITENYVIVGRLDPKRGIKPEIDLTLLDANSTISRQHARIRFERTFFYIEDLKSRNKTRLGQLVLTPLKPELLQHGDEIWFGSVRMVFRIPGKRDTPLPKNLP